MRTNDNLMFIRLERNYIHWQQIFAEVLEELKQDLKAKRQTIKQYTEWQTPYKENHIFVNIQNKILLSSTGIKRSQRGYT